MFCLSENIVPCNRLLRVIFMFASTTDYQFGTSSTCIAYDNESQIKIRNWEYTILIFIT